jgi:host factor-I protein
VLPSVKQALQNKEIKMEKLAQNIQEAFLNNARKDKIFLTIYLMSGVKLSGRIKSFDKYSVILETNNQEQLIFKHAISTVVMSRPLHATAGHGQVATSPGTPILPTEQPEINS